ncbi:hypothetical protein Taro_030229 [Colocasia esculenta]|uniref:Uncharacterized protein n=1 Tax=Colocasia esculenta TaxID=4460 RepID=A0A843VRE5_COLES|nr:hypothetical protein [Colocasia esculenta]
MAESAVALLLGKLSELLSRNLDLVLQLDINIRSLQNKLALLQAFLKDADARRRDSERVKVWINQVRNVAFQAEDAIDRYLYEVQFQRRDGIMGSLKYYANHAGRLKIRRHLAIEIEGIKQMLQEITASKLDFGIELKESEGEASSSYHGLLQSPPKPMPMVEETNVVGFEQDAKILREKLLGGNPRRVAVSIVGMGGLGKTTLATQVYNSDDVKKHFDCQGCVYISQKWEHRELLQSILEKIVNPSKEEIAKMTSPDMENKLKEYLSTRKYLLVIDDIWDSAAWDAVRGALPEGKDGSRIVVTTRREEVARYVDPKGFIHKPQCLDKEKSWDLFCLRDFGSKGGCPEGLREIGEKMVSECAGLPLAITVLGGLLSRKQKTKMEWEKVLKRITYELHEGEDGQNIQRILRLSYDALPYYLRSCFIYFGFFPEDSVIYAEELIQLWVAEGFIQERGQQTMEEVAADYLEELVDRSMIQVVKRNLTGGVKTCRVHDLLLDLSISQGEEEKFLCINVVGNHLSANNVGSAAAPRRVAVHSRGSFFKDNNPSWLGSVRSMFWYSDHPFNLPFPVNDLKLLMVLNIKTSYDIRLLKQIELLVHLRFLGLEGMSIVIHPSSIGMLRNLRMLRNLQTLRLSFWCSLPSTILKIDTLRHIIVDEFYLKGKNGKNVNCMANLQTLGTIKAGSWMGRCLGEFTNLRVLKIKCILANHATILSGCLEKMRFLNKLELEFYFEIEVCTMVVKFVLAALVNCNVLHKLAINCDVRYRSNISRSDSLTALDRRKSQLQRQLSPQQHQSLQFPSSLVKLTSNIPNLLSKQEEASLRCLPNLKILRLQRNA